VWGEALPGAYATGTAGHILGHLAGVSVTYISPIVNDEEVVLFQADDYDDAHDTALEWTDTGSTWPDFTGGVPWLLVRAADGTKFSKAGVIVNPGTPTQTARIELTSAETATFVHRPEPSEFRVRVAVGGHFHTIVDGWLKNELDLA